MGKKEALIRLRYLRLEQVRRFLNARLLRRLAHFRSGGAVPAASTPGLAWQTGCFLRCDEAMTLGWSPCLASTADTTIEKADRILAGQIELFPGYQIDVPDGDIPWHLGPRSNGTWEEWPQSYWANIDIIHAALDPKVTWELNRCQHLQVLGRAYRLTQDERYAAEAARQVRHWIEHNPFEVGINWWSILDVGIRAMSWAWTADLCALSPAWTSEEMQRLLSVSLRQHAQHLSRYLEWHPRPDTHALGEALSLVILGIGFGRLGPAGRWLERGVQTLDRCARCQFTREGVYYEGNLQYHAYALEYNLYAAVLAKRHALRLSVDLDSILKKVLKATISLANPDGILPEIGDDDGGRGSGLDNRRGGRDVRTLVALAAAHLSVPAKTPLNDADWELATWLLGEVSIRRQQANILKVKQQNCSIFLPEAGYAVQRAGQRTLWMRCGSVGMLPYAGHGHADLLHLVIQTEKGPQLVDAGTYTYNGDQSWRWYFRSTPAHNTLMVDGASQARPGHRFSWRDIPECRDTIWQSHPVVDWISAEHAAYPGLVHWRGVLFVRPEYWLIFDELVGSGVRKVSLSYHFSANSWVEIGDGGSRVRSSSGLSLIFLPVDSGDAGHCNKIEGWAAPGYGVRVSIPSVRYEWQGSLPFRMVTLVYPDATAQSECVLKSAGESPNVLHWTIQTPEGEDVLIWNHGSQIYSIGATGAREGITFWRNMTKPLFIYMPQPVSKACIIEDSSDIFCTDTAKKDECDY